MIIHEQTTQLDRMKEVKVKIPVGHHIRLHSMKLLAGKGISDTVAEALELYFKEHAQMRASFEEITGELDKDSAVTS